MAKPSKIGVFRDFHDFPRKLVHKEVFFHKTKRAVEPHQLDLSGAKEFGVLGGLEVIVKKTT